MNMQILFSLSEIWDSKSKNQIVYVIFMYEDISVTTLDITMKFSISYPSREKGVSESSFRTYFLFYVI